MLDSFWNKIKRIRPKDILGVIFFIFAIIPSFILKKSNPNIWLICEDGHEARDNGYWFFKYMVENNKDIDTIYAISKDSPDYEKVSNIGKVIEYSSMSHWIYYLAARLNISTHKGGKPNAAVCYFLEVYDILKNDRVFLQHGITLSNAEWLHFEQTKMRLFICGAYPEYKYVKDNFGYPKDYVKYLGFSRFDNLIDQSTIDEKTILVMPTWRSWLERGTPSYGIYYKGNFLESEYFRKWNEFLTSSKLEEILLQHKVRLIFYPHRKVQKYINEFKVQSDKIIIGDWGKYDIQEALKKSNLLITDYSSVAMDFAYMMKPTIFYQFDTERFRIGQYKEGYFDYKKDSLGVVVEDEIDLLKNIEHYIEYNFCVKEEEIKKIENFFIIRDRKNSQRIFEALRNIN